VAVYNERLETDNELIKSPFLIFCFFDGERCRFATCRSIFLIIYTRGFFFLLIGRNEWPIDNLSCFSCGFTDCWSKRKNNYLVVVVVWVSVIVFFSPWVTINVGRPTPILFIFPFPRNVVGSKSRISRFFFSFKCQRLKYSMSNFDRLRNSSPAHNFERTLSRGPVLRARSSKSQIKKRSRLPMHYSLPFPCILFGTCNTFVKIWWAFSSLRDWGNDRIPRNNNNNNCATACGCI